VERVGAEGDHLAGAAGTLVAEAEVEHGPLTTVADDVGVGGEACVARVVRADGEYGIAGVAGPGFEVA
jgi:hypothetical protein